MSKFVSIICFIITSSAYAQPDRKIQILPNNQIQSQMLEHNSHLRRLTRFSLVDELLLRQNVVVDRPFAEYETARYVIFSADAPYRDALNVKRSILDNLPGGVTALIFAHWPSEAADRVFGPYVQSGKAKMVQVGGFNGFWARDGIPVPVYIKDAMSKPVPALVDARYGHGFEPDQIIGKLFGAKVLKHEYYFEGGNFMNDDKGNCFVVNTDRVETIPDNIFKSLYGCINIHRLPFVAGIGHVDERIKFVTSRIALTDVIEYERYLRGLGYEVRLLPRGEKEYESYTNSLLINGTVYLPVFEYEKDADVIALHKQLGLKVVPVVVDALPNEGMGSIHCITMTYPDMPKVP